MGEEKENRHHRIEIVGLHASNQGRSCSVHSCCGEYVDVGDLLRLVKIRRSVNGGPNYCFQIKCFRIVDGTDSCLVAYIPAHRVKNVEGYIYNESAVLQVIELYHDSEAEHKREKSDLNKGMAGCVFID